MPKRLAAITFLVFLSETLVYFWSATQSPDPGTLTYQLASRYSARISFFMLAALLLWTGVRGLQIIFASERTRMIFVYSLLAFAVNHLIHLYFLSMNFWLNKMSLLNARNLGGAFVYLLIVAAPVYLWNKKILSKKLYLAIHFLLFSTTSLFTFTYVGRFSKELPIPSSPLFFVSALVLIAALVILNVAKIWREGRARITA